MQVLDLSRLAVERITPFPVKAGIPKERSSRLLHGVALRKPLYDDVPQA